MLFDDALGIAGLERGFTEGPEFRDVHRNERAVSYTHLDVYKRQGKNTIQLPVDQPTVVGLIHKGILETVGRLGERSTAGILFPAKISAMVDPHLTDALVGIPPELLSEDDKAVLVHGRPDFIVEIEEHHDLFHSSWRRRLGRW